MRILQEDFDNDLMELKCNVHPLDGLAITARSTGAEIDKASDLKGACFGSDGTAVNLIKVRPKKKLFLSPGGCNGHKIWDSKKKFFFIQKSFLSNTKLKQYFLLVGHQQDAAQNGCWTPRILPSIHGVQQSAIVYISKIRGKQATHHISPSRSDLSAQRCPNGLSGKLLPVIFFLQNKTTCFSCTGNFLWGALLTGVSQSSRNYYHPPGLFFPSNLTYYNPYFFLDSPNSFFDRRK